MADFKVGEIVDVAIKQGRVVEADQTRMVVEHLAVSDDETGQSYTTETAIDLIAESVTVTRVAPPEWPPQVGDKWRDGEGRPWFAHRWRGGFEGSWMYSAAGSVSCSPADFRDSYGPVELVHREEQAGGEGS